MNTASPQPKENPMPRFEPIFPTRLVSALLLVLIFLAGCAGGRLADRYQPGAPEISLWHDESIPLDPAWCYLGTERIPVRGAIWNTSLVSSDQIETLVFTQATDAGTAILLLSRVDKTGDAEVFRYLGGTKTILADQTYRETRYGLDANATDPEYRRYFAAVSQAGLPLAPRYAARILDRLPVETTLVRVLELTPGLATPPLPRYGTLYPQERREPLPRFFF
jgi:hypothetical protein